MARALERLRLSAVLVSLRDFDTDSAIRGLVSMRNLFVHQFRGHAARPELDAATRVRDLEDPIAAQVSGLTDVPAVNAYADRTADELLGVLEKIRRLRDRLHDAFEDEVVRLIRKCSPETRRRFQSYVDLSDFKRGRGPLAE